MTAQLRMFKRPTLEDKDAVLKAYEGEARYSSEHQPTGGETKRLLLNAVRTAAEIPQGLLPTSSVRTLPERVVPPPAIASSGVVLSCLIALLSRRKVRIRLPDPMSERGSPKALHHHQVIAESGWKRRSRAAGL
jgi:hypothetical protein